VVSTWVAVSCGVVLYIPMGVLMPDFLRLWIGPQFALESGPVGRLLALSFIAPSAFAPTATLFRGLGRPGFVTLVMAAAGIMVLVMTLVLIAPLGVVAVGYAYAFSALAWLGGIAGGWLTLHGRSSIAPLARVVGLPLVIGCALGIGQASFREWWAKDLGWLGLFLCGGGFAAVGALIITGVDCALGGVSPAGHFLKRLLGSERLVALRVRLGFSR
jgi:O-antigen/teichoic acid export membrane protein